jgi:hypothetical protein
MYNYLETTNILWYVEYVFYHSVNLDFIELCILGP